MKPQPISQADYLTHLERRMSRSITAAGAVRWRRRALAFRALPARLQTLLGGRWTLLFLKIAADIAHETYLTEASGWPSPQ